MFTKLLLIRALALLAENSDKGTDWTAVLCFGFLGLLIIGIIVLVKKL